MKTHRCLGCMYNYRTVINPISGGCWAPYQWAFKYYPDCFIPEAKQLELAQTYDEDGAHETASKLRGELLHIPKKICVVILEVKDKRGNYVPCIVKENETGYFLTDWQWGKDKELAQKLADEYNEKLGVSKKEVIELTLKSMRMPRSVTLPDGTIENYDADGKLTAVIV